MSVARPNLRPAWAIGPAFVVAFVLLDWISYIRPLHGLNITPWNPQPALAVALLLWNRRLLGWVFAALVAADLFVRGQPVDWFASLSATVALTLCYAAIARALEARLGPSVALGTTRDLLWFTAIIVAGALASGVVYVATFALAGLGPTGAVPEAIVRFWVGDAVGSLVFLPVLVAAIDPRRRASLLGVARSPQAWLAAALVVALLLLVFGRAEHDYFKYFYFVLLPVVWASARLGLPGAIAVAVLTQVGLIVAVEAVPNPDLTVFELQALMAVITMTGLLLGVEVDERERAEAELRGSLRLAAAGQMAAALAHELSQPLTAISSYAQAATLLVSDQGGMDSDARLRRLVDVSRRMAEDAHRASDVVKRLREFFRTGSTQLQPVAPEALLDEAVQAHRKRADAQRIRLESRVAADLPDVLMDRVQIAVVLRNLVTNALDATADLAGEGRVTLDARRAGDDLLVSVEDNGPGVDASRLHSLFEAGGSSKPGGMGVGLGICRAIVEAHGGRLWAEAGPGGRFFLALPVDERGEPGGNRAS